MSQTTPDISAAEARAAVDVIQHRLGAKAEIVVFLGSAEGGAIKAGIYPFGMGRDRLGRTVGAETFAGLVTAVEAASEGYRAEARGRLVVDMALAVIRITDEHGVCMEDELLRTFSRDQIADCGAEACDRASRMAGGRPFEITAPSAPAQHAEAA